MKEVNVHLDAAMELLAELRENAQGDLAKYHADIAVCLLKQARLQLAIAGEHEGDVITWMKTHPY